MRMPRINSIWLSKRKEKLLQSAQLGLSSSVLDGRRQEKDDLNDGRETPELAPMFTVQAEQSPPTSMIVCWSNIKPHKMPVRNDHL